MGFVYCWSLQHTIGSITEDLGSTFVDCNSQLNSADLWCIWQDLVDFHKMNLKSYNVSQRKLHVRKSVEHFWQLKRQCPYLHCLLHVTLHAGYGRDKNKREKMLNDGNGNQTWWSSIGVCLLLPLFDLPAINSSPSIFSTISGEYFTYLLGKEDWLSKKDPKFWR